MYSLRHRPTEKNRKEQKRREWRWRGLNGKVAVVVEKEKAFESRRVKDGR